MQLMRVGINFDVVAAHLDVIDRGDGALGLGVSCPPPLCSPE